MPGLGRETSDGGRSNLGRFGYFGNTLTYFDGGSFARTPLPPNVQIEQGLSSAEKVERVSKSIEAGEVPLFVGDGINDVAAMMQASGSIAMHSGAGLTRSVAMGQLLDDRIEVIPEAVSLTRAILRKLRGNLFYAFVYNLIGMTLAAAGILHPVVAALIMLISSFSVTARALNRASPESKHIVFRFKAVGLINTMQYAYLIH